MHSHFSFPPAYYIYETYLLNYKDYYEDGKGIAMEIIHFIKHHIDFSDANFSILDWGCGPGRIVRHLPPLLPAQTNLYGCDYNNDYIQWCNKNINGVHFIKNELNPPVLLKDASFNCIYGLSILTHLSLPNHLAWVKELERLLKPGGLLLITTQGNQFQGKLMPAELTEFKKGELVTRITKTEGHRVFAAFQPQQFMRTLLNDFEMIQFIPGGSKESIHGLQDTWLVRKPL